MRLLVTAGFAPSLVGFRGSLIRRMIEQRHEVFACASDANLSLTADLLASGVHYVPVPLRRTGLSPFGDCVYLRSIRKLIQQEQIDGVLAYTHKPVVYSALAAGGANPQPRVYAMITGLGFAFITGGGLKKRIAGAVLRFLYRRASRHFTGVIFQNVDDQALFRKLRLVRTETPQIVVRGSGIDLNEFAYAPLSDAIKPESGKLKAEILPSDQDTVVRGQSSVASEVSGFRFQLSAFPVRFLLIARLLGDKGIREYVAAARVIKAQHPNAEFHLVGPTDPNPAAIKLSEVEVWHREGVIVYHGSQKDVRPILRECSVYVLPSYREGTPRTVLEAMATGRAVITTDAPGCRETVFFEKPESGNLKPEMLTERGNAKMVAPSVRPGALAEGGLSGRSPGSERHKPEILKGGIKQGLNGFLVPVKSVDALVSAMKRFINEPELAVSMGREGRRLAEEHYDVHKVNQQILEFMGLSREAAKAET